MAGSRSAHPHRSQVSVIHERSNEGAVNLFVIGTDGQVWSNFWLPGRVEPMERLVPDWAETPVGAQVSVIDPLGPAEGAVSLYVIGSDGQVWSNFWRSRRRIDPVERVVRYWAEHLSGGIPRSEWPPPVG